MTETDSMIRYMSHHPSKDIAFSRLTAAAKLTKNNSFICPRHHDRNRQETETADNVGVGECCLTQEAEGGLCREGMDDLLCHNRCMSVKTDVDIATHSLDDT